MLPSKHIILGLVFSLIVFYLFPGIGILGFFTIFLASFLIDVDHYLYFIFAYKDFSLKNAHKWFLEKHKKFFTLSQKERAKIKPAPCIFHGIEALTILAVLSFVSPFFFYVLVGFVFHEFLDLINILYYGFPLYHIGSQTYNIINHKIEK